MNRVAISTLVWFFAPIVAEAADADCWPGFVAAPKFAEQVREIRFASAARAVVVAPDAAKFDPNLPTQLVIFATPNGNTIEQTLGCARAEGRDWHFNIQHVAAQVRHWRAVHTSENVVLACVQADLRSWPTWRQRYADSFRLIRRMVDAIAGQVPSDDTHIVLTGHSGGGSFIAGFVNSVDAIPSAVGRIAYLDANYSYSTDEGHGRKFVEWLQADPTRQFVVLAYDDREIELDGKKVVGPTGGTYRASHRLLDYLDDQTTLIRDTLGEFQRTTCYDERLRVLIHPNPGNRILHTRLVGEMNGLVYALATGTADEGAWGMLGTPRVYNDWVQSEPFEPGDWRPATLAIPERRADTVGGEEFARRWADASAEDREAAVLAELLNGNVPPFLRQPVSIHVDATTADGEQHELEARVLPDYLAIGSDDDFLRMPITPATAQLIADAYACVLPTRKLVDEIHRQAMQKISPQPLTENRESLATFVEHHRLIEAERSGPLGGLLSGIKKDVVVTNQLAARPGHVAIYGWHHADGTPIQPLTTIHVARYVDYSHGIRLVDRRVLVDGEPARFDEVLADAELHVLLSDEGPIAAASYAAELRGP